MHELTYFLCTTRIVDSSLKLPEILHELATLKENQAVLAYMAAIVGYKSARLQLIEIHIRNLHERLQWIERTVAKTLNSFADDCR